MAPDQKPPTSPKVTKATTMEEVMTRLSCTILSDETVARARALMMESHAHHLPVMRGGKLVGVLSQRDLDVVRAIAGADAKVEPVSVAMATDIYIADGRDRVRDVLQIMSDQRCGAAVIVDRGGVRGIFTSTDALRLLAEEMR